MQHNNIMSALATQFCVCGSGGIYMILGPMFSGKTTELQRRFRMHELAGQRCAMIKYSGDTRYSAGAQVVSHDGDTCNATFVCNRLGDLDISEFDVVCVDEVQFYADAAKTCDLWANAGKLVHVCGLNGDYRRRPFEQVSRLVALADGLQHMVAICRRTGLVAPFSARITTETEQECIGGADKYEAVSRSIYMGQPDTFI